MKSGEKRTMKFSKSAGCEVDTPFPIRMENVPTFEEKGNENVDDNGNKVHEQNGKKRVKWLDECAQSSIEIYCESIQEEKDEENYTNNSLVFDIDRGELPEGSDIFQKTLKDLREEQQYSTKLSACIVMEEPATLDKDSCNIKKSMTKKIIQGQGSKEHSNKALLLGYKLRSKDGTYMKFGMVNRLSES